MSNISMQLPRPFPGNKALVGKTVRLEPINWDKHGLGLGQALVGKDTADLWTYISFGPFDKPSDLLPVLRNASKKSKWAPMAIVRTWDDAVLGTASYMRIRPEHGSVEIGCVLFSKALQRSYEATESMYLYALHVFEDLGYRRYEWKCDKNNAASKRAAERFGFKYEGLFRNDQVVKGKNRDTAWFAMTDEDWPRIKLGFEAWLSADNFDEQGQQKSTLSACRMSNA